MAFQKVIVIMSGGGDTGLIKLSGSFDGLNDVRCECKCGNPRKGSKLYVFADADTGLESSEHIHVIRMPENYGPLSPILHVIPLQLLAYHTAFIRGNDVDKPRNLAKSVTVE